MGFKKLAPFSWNVYFIFYLLGKVHPSALVPLVVCHWFLLIHSPTLFYSSLLHCLAGMVEETRRLPEALAKQGRVPISTKRVAQLIGKGTLYWRMQSLDALAQPKSHGAKLAMHVDLSYKYTTGRSSIRGLQGKCKDIALENPGVFHPLINQNAWLQGCSADCSVSVEPCAVECAFALLQESFMPMHAHVLGNWRTCAVAGQLQTLKWRITLLGVNSALTCALNDVLVVAAA
eukprot:1053416-Pelagomonas_calceolata.AAC.1